MITFARRCPGRTRSRLESADGTWFILTTSAYAGRAQNTAAGFTVKGIESVLGDPRSRGVELLEYDFGEMGKTQAG
ncbi:MAG: hypothetical protein ACRDNY_11415 [Gaiellaceae bacterium]